MNIDFYNNVFDLENSALLKINLSNLRIMPERFASDVLLKSKYKEPT